MQINLFTQLSMLIALSAVMLLGVTCAYMDTNQWIIFCQDYIGMVICLFMAAQITSLIGLITGDK